MEYLGLWLVISTIPAIIAHKKEQNFFVWWFFGVVLLPVALIMAILMGPARRCFYCDQAIRKTALVCSNCGRDVLTDAEIDALAAEPLDAP